MKHNIKILALDLDGTLFTDEKMITASTLQAIHDVAEKGVLIIPATGRPMNGIPEPILAIPEVEYVLTSNGARVVKLTKRNTDGSYEYDIIAEYLLDKEKGLKALHMLKKYDTLCEAYFHGQGYAPKAQRDKVQRYHQNPHMWEYFWSTRVFVDDLETFVKEEQGDLDKIQALFAIDHEREVALKELTEFGGLALVGSLSYNIEINGLNVNKGRSLVDLGKLLGIRREEIMAIGDGDNDFEMIKEVGVGIAMSNGEKHVIEAAKYVTDSNNNEGVTKAIHRYILD